MTRFVKLAYRGRVEVKGERPAIYWRDPEDTTSPFAGRWMLASPELQDEIEAATLRANSRVTQKELFDLLRVLNSQGVGKYDLEWAYGRPRLTTDDGSREVSPRLSTGQMADWMRAFLAGIGARRRRGTKRNPLLAEVLANPRRRGMVGVFRGPHGGALMGDAVYEIKYRHAEDGMDYVHPFSDPDNVTIEVMDSHTVIIRGEGKPIIEDVTG